jgi:hydrogenase maturation protease
MSGRPLVLAFGNRLRGDDAVGWVVADALADDLRMEEVDVVAVHQLSPELADDVSRASLVVFVDARLDPTRVAGAVAVAVLEPDVTAASMTHHVAPGAVLALARTLYGQAPPAFTVSVAIESAEPGAPLGVAVSASVSALVDTVVRLCGSTADA